MTGASDGVGHAFAHRLAEAAFDLVIVAQREAALAHLTEELRDRHEGRVGVRPADLSDPAQVEAIA